jgi:hypothetical protein
VQPLRHLLRAKKKNALLSEDRVDWSTAVSINKGEGFSITVHAIQRRNGSDNDFAGKIYARITNSAGRARAPGPARFWATPKTRRPPCPFFLGGTQNKTPALPGLSGGAQKKTPALPGISGGAQKKTPGPNRKEARTALESKVLSRKECKRTTFPFADHACVEKTQQFGF